MSNYQPSQPGKKKFRRVSKGELPSAAEYNNLLEVVEKIQELRLSNQDGFWIKPIRMSEAMGEFGAEDSSDEQDREGVVRYFDVSIRDWVDPATETAETKSNIANALHSAIVYDEGEILFGMYDRQSGKYVPINPQLVRHAITCKNDDGDYPQQHNCDNTYPVKFIRMVYDKTKFYNTPTVTYLESEDAGPDDVVFNAYTGDAEDENGDRLGTYIPEGTIIWCYFCRDSWFTYVVYNICEGSSSSSSSNDSVSSSSSKSSSNSSSKSSSNSSSTSSSHSSSTASSASSSESSFSSSSKSSSSASSFSSVSSSSKSSASSVSSTSGNSESSVSVSQSSGVCIAEFAGPIADALGYREGVIQILTHNEDGCLRWVDWEDCP